MSLDLSTYVNGLFIHCPGAGKHNGMKLFDKHWSYCSKATNGGGSLHTQGFNKMPA